jgi:hypothetical protein
MGTAKTKAIRQAPIKSFSEVLKQLEAEPSYLEQYVYAELRFGTFYWIPDEDSCFGDRDKHPWVIIAAFQPGRPTVQACPRTSRRVEARGSHELAMPAGILAELERDGVIVLDRRQPFLAARFRSYRFIGNLPEAWQRQLHDALVAEGHRITRESAEP